MNYTVLLVDDEKINLEILSKILSIHCPKVQIIGQVKTIERTVEAIESKRPDIVFLDINLGQKQIFEVLDQIEQIDFQIVFATAYPGYFFKASEYNPVDFVVKPYHEIAVKEAVKKATKRIKKLRKQLEV